MNIFDVLCGAAAAVVLVTALARLNDIKKSQATAFWWVRRTGLGLVSVAMIMIIAAPFSDSTPHWSDIVRLLALWGIAMTWVTTPGMPPWWRFVSRYESNNAGSGRRVDD